MKKQIVIDEKEFDELPIKLAEAMWESLKQGYGYKLISRETGEECESFEQFLGFTLIATGKVLRTDK